MLSVGGDVVPCCLWGGCSGGFQRAMVGCGSTWPRANAACAVGRVVQCGVVCAGACVRARATGSHLQTRAATGERLERRVAHLTPAKIKREHLGAAGGERVHTVVGDAARALEVQRGEVRAVLRDGEDGGARHFGAQPEVEGAQAAAGHLQHDGDLWRDSAPTERGGRGSGGAHRHLADSFVRYTGTDPQVERGELAAASGERVQPAVGHFRVPFQLQRRERRAPRGELCEACVGHRSAPAHVKRLEARAVLGEQRERVVGDAAALSHAERAQRVRRPRERAHARVGDESAPAKREALEARGGTRHRPARELAAALELQVLELAAPADEGGDAAVGHPRAPRDVQPGEALCAVRDDVQRAVGQVAPAELEGAEAEAAGDEGGDAAVPDIAAAEELHPLQRGHRARQQLDARVANCITTLERKVRQRVADAGEEGDVGVGGARVREAEVGECGEAAARRPQRGGEGCATK